MLTMTNVLRYIEAGLGYRFRDLEIDDNEIENAIINTTLPIFSSYFPCYYRRLINAETDLVEGTYNQYYIDSTDPNEEYELLGVSKVYVSDITNMGYDRNAILGNNYSTGFGGVLKDAFRMPVNPLVFNYIPPNIVEIRPSCYQSSFLAELKIVHPSHLRTIHPGMEEEFKLLALYDISMYLYSIRNRFSDLQTPFGSIALSLDNLQEAASNRTELLQKFNSHKIKSSQRKKIWMA